MIQLAIFTSALVLLLNIWGAKRSGLKFDIAKEVKEVHACLEMLKQEEDRHVLIADGALMISNFFALGGTMQADLGTFLLGHLLHCTKVRAGIF